MLLRTAHLERGAAPRAVARALLSTSATTSSAASTAPPRLASLPSRSVLEVSGPDAQKFLRGQMCKDVEPLAGGYSGFLNASVS
jgi:folate-binding Fe-S cluster repair protein YgfZ